MERAGMWPVRKSGTAARRPSLVGMCLVGCSSPEFSSVHETRAQARQGFGAMAQLVFHLLAQLGERLLITVGNKERIVAKAALPLRSKADMPFTYAIEQFGLQLKFVSVTNGRRTSSRFRQNRCQREHAAKARRPFLHRNVLQQMEQFGVVGAVRRVAGPARGPTVSTAHEPSPLPPFRLRQGYGGRVGHPLPLGGGEGWVRGVAVRYRGAMRAESSGCCCPDRRE